MEGSIPLPDALPARIAHALTVYAEQLVAGRRVIVVGDATLGVGERLVALGARLVHVYDPDAARAHASAAAGPRGVMVHALPAANAFDVRDGAFDVAIVPELAMVPDPAQLMVRLRRLLGAQGTALVATRNDEAAPHAIDYYALYDLVSLQFAHVRMLGETSFSGLAIVELGEAAEDAAVSVDAQLAGAPAAPLAFVALASARDVHLDPYAIVQMPAREEAGADLVELERARIELAEARLQVQLLTAQIDEQRVSSQRLAAEESRAARVAELETQLTALEARSRDAESRAGDEHVRAERLGHEIKKLEEELERQRERAFRLVRELEDEKKARQKAELELGMIRKSPELAQMRDRIGYLEEALRASEEVAGVLQARVVELEAIHAARAEQMTLLGAEVEALRVAAELGQAAAQQVDELAQRAEHAEHRARSLERDLAASDLHVEELAQLEATLRERAHAVHALEQELARRARMVEELVASIEEEAESAPAPESGEAAVPPAPRAAETALVSENAELRAKLDQLALDLARREGESQATAWRVVELERELAARKEREEQAEPAVEETDVLEQLDVLRQALAQEHAARQRLESGEELSRARAELQRQAALIEQLSRELEARHGEGAPQPHSPSE